MSGTKRTRLGSIFCLIALLAQLILPLGHQSQLHALEELYASVALDAGQEAKLLLGSAESEDPHAHHNANSCPICQASLSSRYFAAPTLSLSPVISLPVQRFCNETVTSIIVSPDILSSGPRSPPISL